MKWKSYLLQSISVHIKEQIPKFVSKKIPSNSDKFNAIQGICTYWFLNPMIAQNSLTMVATIKVSFIAGNICRRHEHHWAPRTFIWNNITFLHVSKNHGSVIWAFNEERCLKKMELVKLRNNNDPLVSLITFE